MKKRILSILLISICPLFLSACVKTDTDIVIDKKGNATFSSKLLFDKNVANYMGDTLNPEYYKKNSQDTEMEFTKIHEDGYVGIKSHKNIKNIYKNDLSTLLDESYLTPKNKKFLEINKSVFHKNIKINLVSNFSNMKDANGKAIDKNTAELITPTFRITIPYKAYKNNAQHVTNDSHTYEWKPSTSNSNEIILEYNIINFLNISIFAIAILLLILGIIFYSIKKQKKLYISLFATSGILLLYIIIFEIVCFIGNIPRLSVIEKVLKQATEINKTEAIYLIEDYEETPAKKYHFFDNKEFTDVFEFKDKGVSVYKFSVETDFQVGNGNDDDNYFSYEIGRIYVNPQDSKKSKCTYNYMGKFSDEKIDYFECSESQFIKSLPEIAKIKKEKFNELKKAYKERELIDICGMADNENTPECSRFNDKNWEQEWERIENSAKSSLTKLRCATLDKMSFQK
ncbi:MAG: hypothetical protein MJ229_03560 [bacterium]|nr:hypothetical protein [bacterium]